jgi:hypothetical protein
VILEEARRETLTATVSDMAYSVVNVDDVEGVGETVRCPVAGPDGMTFGSVGSRRGSYEPRGPF